MGPHRPGPRWRTRIGATLRIPATPCAGKAPGAARPGPETMRGPREPRARPGPPGGGRSPGPPAPLPARSPRSLPPPPTLKTAAGPVTARSPGAAPAAPARRGAARRGVSGAVAALRAPSSPRPATASPLCDGSAKRDRAPPCRHRPRHVTAEPVPRDAGGDRRREGDKEMLLRACAAVTDSGGGGGQLAAFGAALIASVCFDWEIRALALVGICAAVPPVLWEPSHGDKKAIPPSFSFA